MTKKWSLWAKVCTLSRVFDCTHNTQATSDAHPYMHHSLSFSLSVNQDLLSATGISLYVPQRFIQCQWNCLCYHLHLRRHSHRATTSARGNRSCTPAVHKQATLGSAPRRNQLLANAAPTPITILVVVAPLAPLGPHFRKEAIDAGGAEKKDHHN